MLPDYMVHRSYNSKSASGSATGLPICPPAPSGVPYRKPIVQQCEGRPTVYENQTTVSCIACIEICTVSVTVS